MSIESRSEQFHAATAAADFVDGVITKQLAQAREKTRGGGGFDRDYIDSHALWKLSRGLVTGQEPDYHVPSFLSLLSSRAPQDLDKSWGD